MDLQTAWPYLLTKPEFFIFRVFFRACSLQNQVGDPPFFYLFGKRGSLPFCVASLKKILRRNILGANVGKLFFSPERRLRYLFLSIFETKLLKERRIIMTLEIFVSGSSNKMTSHPVKTNRPRSSFHKAKKWRLHSARFPSICKPSGSFPFKLRVERCCRHISSILKAKLSGKESSLVLSLKENNGECTASQIIPDSK